MATLDQSQVAGSSLGYAQITSNATTSSATPTAITGLSTGVTVPNGGRRVKITVSGDNIQNSGANYNTLYIYSGASSGALTTLLATCVTGNTSGMNYPPLAIAVVQPSAGSVFYTAAFSTGGGTTTLAAASTAPAFILAEVI